MSSELAYKVLIYVFLEILSIQNLFSITLSLKFTTLYTSIYFIFFLLQTHYHTLPYHKKPENEI